MPLILTGVYSYSTTYADERGVEQRVSIRKGQDAEKLGLPSHVLDRLKQLKRGAGVTAVPYFTHVSHKAEPNPKPASTPKEAPEERGKAVSAAGLAQSRERSLKEQGVVVDEPEPESDSEKEAPVESAVEEVKAEETPAEEPKIEAPAEEPKVETPAEEPKVETPAAEPKKKKAPAKKSSSKARSKKTKPKSD